MTIKDGMQGKGQSVPHSGTDQNHQGRDQANTHLDSVGNTTHYYMDGGNQMQSEYLEEESPTLNTKTSRNLESLRETAYLIIDNQGQFGTLKL